MILEGKKLAKEVLEELKPFFQKRKVALVLISVGKEAENFIKEKRRVAGELGIEFLHFHFSEEVSNKFLRRKISEIAKKDFIKGIVVQLPLPKKFNTQYILNAIPPEKDPDCLNERSFGAFALSRNKIFPPSVEALKFILEKYGINPQGKICAVLGTGRLIGLPIALYLLQQKATVLLLNEFTPQMEKWVKKAEMVISGVGKANLVNEKMVKKGAILIDFGYALEEGKVRGDLDFKNLEKKASLITPTPGGTGPLVVAFLFKNLKRLIEKD